MSSKFSAFLAAATGKSSPARAPPPRPEGDQRGNALSSANDAASANSGVDEAAPPPPPAQQRQADRATAAGTLPAPLTITTPSTTPSTSMSAATGAATTSSASPVRNIEDKYFDFASPAGAAAAFSPQVVQEDEVLSAPPADVVQNGPSAVAQWYKAQATLFQQRVTVSQQRNQMLVQKVLEMRRRAGSPRLGAPHAPEEDRGESSNTMASPSSASLLHVEELAPSPAATTNRNSQTAANTSTATSSSSPRDKITWMEMKLQRSQQNFHALSRRTREMESNNAKAAQMIIDLRTELQGQREMAENATRREVDGRNLVSQLNAHVESLSQQLAGMREQYRMGDVRATQAEERAARWKRERREIGGYALRLEKSAESTKTELDNIKGVVRRMTEELREAKDALERAGEKIKAQRDQIKRLESGEAAGSRRLHLAVNEGVNALRAELDYSASGAAIKPNADGELVLVSAPSPHDMALTTHTLGNPDIMRLKRQLDDSRRMVDRRNAELQALETQNEVLTVRSQHSTRALEEYREKAKKLQEILAAGNTGRDGEILRFRTAAATAEAQLGTARRDAERCRDELKQALTAMEAARDRIAQSKDAMDAAERRAEAARVRVKEAEGNTRSAQRQLEVVTEDCVATKRELGALQADNAHLEQQLIAAQHNLAVARESREGAVVTNEAIEAQLEVSLNRAQAAQTKVRKDDHDEEESAITVIMLLSLLLSPFVFLVYFVD